MTRLTALTTFSFVLALGAILAISMGGDFRVSLGVWFALVASFAFGVSVGREEAKDA